MKSVESMLSRYLKQESNRAPNNRAYSGIHLDEDINHFCITLKLRNYHGEYS